MDDEAAVFEPPRTVPRRKPVLCLAFDGVLHDGGRSVVHAPDVIAGRPVPGFDRFLLAALEHFSVCVYSSRSSYNGAIAAMQKWLWEQLYDVRPELGAGEITDLVDRIGFPRHKPATAISLDAWAVTFAGAWPDPSELLAFRPWQPGGER